MNGALTIDLDFPRAGFDLRVSLELPSQGITVLYGASGSGKTSVLRCLAGLERAPRARVVLDGQVWQDEAQGIFLPTHRRGLGYVFQEASLFDHLDVQGNLAYGMQRARAPEARRTLQAAIELLGIGGLLARRPHQLSGGERQRVAIARALATAPKLLLLDEPLASLDVARRQDILPWLDRLRREWQLPMVYVTHSPDELARLAEYLVVLNAGRVQASGPVKEVLTDLSSPVLPGEEAGALLDGVVVERSADWQLARVAFDGGSLWLRDSGVPLDRPVRLRVLARDVSLAAEEPRATSIQNICPCVVEAIVPDHHPSQVLVRVRCGSAVLLARITRRAQHALGLTPASQVWAQVKSVALLP